MQEREEKKSRGEYAAASWKGVLPLLFLYWILAVGSLAPISYGLCSSSYSFNSFFLHEMLTQSHIYFCTSFILVSSSYMQCWIDIRIKRVCRCLCYITILPLLCNDALTQYTCISINRCTTHRKFECFSSSILSRPTEFIGSDGLTQ